MIKTFRNNLSGITTKIDGNNQIVEQFEEYRVKGDDFNSFDVKIEFTPEKFDYSEVEKFLAAYKEGY